MKSKLLSSLMVLFLSVSLFAQEKITGVVKDNLGPAAGVSVVEQGTVNGTVTDLDGKFEITVKSGAVLTFSLVGYRTQAVEVGDKTYFEIVMEEDNEFLDEVVVVGYGVQKKKLVTGATIQVKGEELAKLNTVSPLEALQSSTPGMQIISESGQPGSNFKVTIRGMGTIGSYEPLYVIDGVAGGSINSLNASDIESIDVLKDAASCAIYGARGANGVVLVTTKQGKEGKITVTYDGFYGVQNLARIIEPLNAKQYMQVMDMVEFNGGRVPTDWANVLDKDLYNSIQNGTFTGTNWLNEIRNQNAPTTNQAVNITGGTDRSKFSMGVSYTGQEGILGKPVASNYKRFTVRVNSDHVLWKKGGLDIVSLGENITYTTSSSSGIAEGDHYWNNIYDMLSANPLIPMYDPQNPDKYTEYDWNKKSGIWNLNPYAVNPVAHMVYSSNGNNYSKSYDLRLSANLRVQPIKNLIWKSQFNYSMSAGTYRSYSMIYKLNDKSDSRNVDAVSQSASAGWSWSWENTINYKFSVADNNFDVLVGSTLEKNGFGESVGANGNTGLWPNDWTHAYVSNMVGAVSLGDRSGSTWGDWALASFFGRINYDYKEKYMLSLILRRDGSSNFARGKRWGTFPSVSAGWVMTNEPWMEGAKGILDFFKIRGSWGQNGNCDVANFQYLSTVSVGEPTGGYSFYTGKPAENAGTGSFVDTMSNPDITWETSQQLDFGFDARLFDDRLSIVFDWYKKDTKNWLVNAPIMGHFGAKAPYINGGDVRNSGVELALSWQQAFSNDFSFNVGVNGAYNKNIVTRIANDEGIIHGPGDIVQGIDEIYRAQVNYPIGYFWGYKTDGVFQNQKEIDAWTSAGKPTMRGTAIPGDLKFVDLNGDGVLNDDDKTMVGDPNPDFTLGVNIGFNFKGFDLSFSGYGMFGQQIFRSYRRYGDMKWDNYTTEAFKYWHGEGTSNRYPLLTHGTDANFINNSNLFIENGDFFRLQNATLGYDFNRLIKNSKLGQIRFYVQGQNLFVITKYMGLDPEVGSSAGQDNWAKGLDLGYYPHPRTFLVGLNLKF